MRCVILQPFRMSNGTRARPGAEVDIPDSQVPALERAGWVEPETPAPAAAMIAPKRRLRRARGRSDWPAAEALDQPREDGSLAVTLTEKPVPTAAEVERRYSRQNHTNRLLAAE